MARGKSSKPSTLRSHSKRSRHTRGGTSGLRRPSTIRSQSKPGGKGKAGVGERLRRARQQAKRTGRTSRKREQPSVSPGKSPLRRRAAQRQPRTPAAARTRRSTVRGGTTTRTAAHARSRASSRSSVATAAGTRTADLQVQIEQLRSRFSRLEVAAALADIQQTLGRTDARLADLPRELEALRSRGYVHAGLLDEEIASLTEQWSETRSEAERALQRRVRALSRQVSQTAQEVNRLSVHSAASISAATAAVSTLQSQVNGARSSVRGHFSSVEHQISSVEDMLEHFDWVLEQFDRSANVRLQETEAPLEASKAEWYRDGDEGPEGMLFLTDQRLLFEQNEEIAKEKLFGLFTTESDLVQRLLLDLPVHQIEKISHGEEGGFLGIGKQEMLDLVLDARAPVSRARFHIQGQDAADWAVWLKRVQTGEVDRDRDEAYVEEVEAAASRVERFPTKCPSCFAPVPTPPRGARTATCGYCGTVIKPMDDAGVEA